MNYSKKGITAQKKKVNSVTDKLASKLRVTILKILAASVLVLMVVGCCLGLGVVNGIIENAPDVATINVKPTAYATKIYDCDGNEIETLIAEGSNRVYANIEDIPLNLQHAFVAIEDERFYEHNGIDLKGILRAISVAVKNMKLSEGASTITQQLLKNTVFDAYNESEIDKIKRKIQEQYLAVKLETTMSKDAILENYLNVINLGNGNLGVQSAANNYFNKDVSELTLSECAVIAAITQNPYRYNPVTHPEENQKRQQKVLKNMYEQGYITESEYKEALADDVYSRIQDISIENNSSSVYTYFTDALIEVLIEDLQEQKGYTYNQASNLVFSGGLSVYSTQDSTMQAIADRVLNDPANFPAETEVSISLSLTVEDADNKVRQYNQNSMQTYFQTIADMPTFKLTFDSQEKATEYVERYKQYLTDSGYTILDESLLFTIQPQVSFTLIDQYTGYVKVIVGGRGDKLTSRSLNRATSATRSPGSSIKPLAVYGPALDSGGMTLATVYDDAPYYYQTGDKLVNNYEMNYLGLMSFRTALMRSRNVPAVKILTAITPALGFSYCESFGLTTLVSPEEAINGNHDVVQALALGGLTKGVYNIDMTAAYAAYANGGIYTEPVYYTKVYDHDGNLILDNTVSETHRVVKATTAWLMTSAMQSVVTSGTGTLAQIDNQPVAGKTGTSNTNGDFWFCGFTPYYTASIWVGYDDNSALSKSIKHTKMWSLIMSEIHENLPTGEWVQPDGIVEVEVCAQSGKLPIEGVCDHDPRGSQLVTEYFVAGTEPTEYCDVHVKVTICNDSGEIATSNCTNTSTQIYIQKPESNVIIPEGAEEYFVADSIYEAPEGLLESTCHLHQNNAEPGILPFTHSSGINNNNSNNSNNNSSNNAFYYDE